MGAFTLNVPGTLCPADAFRYKLWSAKDSKRTSSLLQFEKTYQSALQMHENLKLIFLTTIFDENMEVFPNPSHEV